MSQAKQDPGDASQPRSLRHAGLADEAYHLILDQLVSLKIPPGARITVDELARSYGISQTPIREALNRLEINGLVTKTHLVGYRAAPQFTREQFYELYEIRMLLEPVAVRNATARIEPAEQAELEHLIAEMHREIVGGGPVNYGRFALHDSAFHGCVARAGRNGLIADALARLHSQVHIVRHFFNTRVTEGALLEHRAIAEAIAAGDAGRAEQAMRLHIEESWKRLEQGF